VSNTELNVTDHDRDSAGLKYVYPVVSRRAGGVSVGINLNTNNACNWRCIYCQVPDLQLGTAPPVDLILLEKELRSFLHELLHGDFMQQRVPEESRRINDIALSGNGEPTSAREFVQVIELIGKLKQELALPKHIKLILISNGSLMHRDYVQQGLRKMAELGGEVWFKLDRASAMSMQAINNTNSTLAKIRQSLLTAISLCPTWLQTCWFATDGAAPSTQEEDEFLEFISGLIADNTPPLGMLLYTLARPSLQPEATRLSALSSTQLEVFASRIRRLGVTVKVSE
jgi:wyosine [tRNA(Phe)-imidazoG37] synthetase (radical SAM superfamily)